MSEQPPVEALLDHLTAFAHAPAVDVTMDWADAHGADAAVEQLLVPAQHEVGRRWEFGEWTVAQEHAATAIVEDILGGLHVDLEVDVRHEAPHVALVCAEDEWHVTPLRMAAVRLLARGWRVTLLGASTPVEHLRSTLEAVKPDMLGLSVTLAVHLAGARRTVQAAHDVGLAVIAGGGALGDDDHRAEAIGAEVGGLDVAAADSIMRGWLDHAAPLRSPVLAHPQEVERLRTTRRVVARGSLARLQGSRPVVGEYGVAQLERTEEDLVWILRHAEAALDVADPRIFREFLAWLVSLLVVRGVPQPLLTAGLTALVEQLDDDLTATRSLLEAGATWVESGRPATESDDVASSNGDATP